MLTVSFPFRINQSILIRSYFALIERIWKTELRQGNSLPLYAHVFMGLKDTALVPYSTSTAMRPWGWLPNHCIATWDKPIYREGRKEQHFQILSNVFFKGSVTYSRGKMIILICNNLTNNGRIPIKLARIKTYIMLLQNWIVLWKWA